MRPPPTPIPFPGGGGLPRPQREADPDPEHLRHLLRHIFQNRDEARAKGASAAREMAEKWTWEQSARRIVARFEALEA